LTGCEMTLNKTAALICENYRREIEEVVLSEGIEDVDIFTFPANCHKSHMENRSFSCNRLIGEGSNYDGVHVFGCSCVMDAQCGHLATGACVRHKEEHCFNMLAEKKVLLPLFRDGAYLLSPGWLEKWRYYLADWGMERQIATEFFAESVSKLVLLDTRVDSHSADRLAEFADFIRRPSETIPVGLDFFRNYVVSKIG
jgi:hypothetical protein